MNYSLGLWGGIGNLKRGKKGFLIYSLENFIYDWVKVFGKHAHIQMKITPFKKG